MPAYYDYEMAGFHRAIFGMFIIGFVFLAALGGVIGLVWLTLAATRQAARASMHAHRARKAGVVAGGNGGTAVERMSINGDIDPATLKEY